MVLFPIGVLSWFITNRTQHYNGTRSLWLVLCHQLVAQDQGFVLSLPGHRGATKMGRILGDHMVLFREVDVASSPWLITNRSSVSLMILSPTSPCLCSAHCLIIPPDIVKLDIFFHNCARIHFTIAVISSWSPMIQIVDTAELQFPFILVSGFEKIKWILPTLAWSGFS